MPITDFGFDPFPGWGSGAKNSLAMHLLPASSEVRLVWHGSSGQVLFDRKYSP